MENLIGDISLAMIAFVLTNIDDLLILSFYFANKSSNGESIVIGQYVGVFSLVLISLSGFVIGKFVDPQWLRFLGFIPMALGIKQLIGLFRRQDDDSEIKSSQSFWSVALVTIANGGDNIGVYTPLFAKLNLQQLIVYLLVFAIMIAIWCVFAFYLVKHPVLKKTFTKYGHIALPVFLILLGLWIFLDF
ncbi:MAG TPA: cadmium resistance transporter [Cyclobacteriaceae bacterium]